MILCIRMQFYERHASLLYALSVRPSVRPASRVYVRRYRRYEVVTTRLQFCWTYVRCCSATHSARGAAANTGRTRSERTNERTGWRHATDERTPVLAPCCNLASSIVVATRERSSGRANQVSTLELFFRPPAAEQNGHISFSRATDG